MAETMLIQAYNTKTINQSINQLINRSINQSWNKHGILFQSDKPESPLAQAKCRVDVCFLYSDTEGGGESRWGHSKNPDDKTIHKIRAFLEDKKVRCSIARPPADDTGNYDLLMIIVN